MWYCYTCACACLHNVLTHTLYEYTCTRCFTCMHLIVSCVLTCTHLIVSCGSFLTDLLTHSLGEVPQTLIVLLLSRLPGRVWLSTPATLCTVYIELKRTSSLTCGKGGGVVRCSRMGGRRDYSWLGGGWGWSAWLQLRLARLTAREKLHV